MSGYRVGFPSPKPLNSRRTLGSARSQPGRLCASGRARGCFVRRLRLVPRSPRLRPKGGNRRTNDTHTHTGDALVANLKLLRLPGVAMWRRPSTRSCVPAAGGNAGFAHVLPRTRQPRAATKLAADLANPPSWALARPMSVSLRTFLVTVTPILVRIRLPSACAHADLPTTLPPDSGGFDPDRPPLKSWSCFPGTSPSPWRAPISDKRLPALCSAMRERYTSSQQHVERNKVGHDCDLNSLPNHIAPPHNTNPHGPKEQKCTWVAGERVPTCHCTGTTRTLTRNLALAALAHFGRKRPRIWRYIVKHLWGQVPATRLEPWPVLRLPHDIKVNAATHMPTRGAGVHTRSHTSVFCLHPTPNGSMAWAFVS